MDLRDYEQSKFAIAEILRAASVLVPDKNLKWRAGLKELFAKLAEDRFNLVVVGRFSRGKSSLMNAILGTDRLPTGIAPLTSVVTTVTYGSKEQVVLKYQNRILDKEIPIEALLQHITQQGNPENVQQIKTAEVQLPAEFLRRGFYFVDTPGFGSVIRENTLTTQAFLPEADAFILVTSYESPLSEEEMQFFKAGISSGRRIFVVLNKHDMVSVQDRQAAFEFVREQANRTFGPSPPQIFSVSSTEGLAAKRTHDSKRLAASGIRELENKLVSFLLMEKSSEFLLRMCDRVRQFLQELPCSETTADLISQVGELAKQYRGDRETVPAEPLTGSTATFPNLHWTGSCEVCAHVAERLWDFLCRYQCDLVVNRDEQDRLAGRGGFCPFHTWEYESIASPYGICNGFPGLLDRLAAKLRETASTPSPRQVLQKVQGLLPAEDDCVVCNVRNEAEREAIEAAARRLELDQKAALGSLSAVCLPHFVMLVTAVQSDDAARELIERQAVVLQRFSEDMKRYSLKHDAVRRDLASQEETTVATRGLQLIAGRRNVNFMPNEPTMSRSRGTPITAKNKGAAVHPSKPARSVQDQGSLQDKSRA